MKSFEALNLVIGRDTVEHAKALKLKPGTVGKWKESPEASGSPNPLDRVETMTLTAIELQRGDAAFEALRYLARRFGFLLVPVAVGEISAQNLLDKSLSVLRAQGDFMAALCGSIEGRETIGTASRRIVPRGNDAMEAIADLLQTLKGQQ